MAKKSKEQLYEDIDKTVYKLKKLLDTVDEDYMFILPSADNQIHIGIDMEHDKLENIIMGLVEEKNPLVLTVCMGGVLSGVMSAPEEMALSIIATLQSAMVQRLSQKMANGDTTLPTDISLN